MSTTNIVYLVDHHDTERADLEKRLMHAGYIVSAYAGLDDFLQGFDPTQACCLIIEVSMPEASGLDLLRWLRDRGVDRPVIFTSASGNIPLAVRLIRGGALDFVEKPVQDQHLRNAVEHALRQDRRARQEAERRRAVMGLYTRLTPREREIMARVADGESNRVIAANLGLSPRTVEVHRARVMEKMRADSLSELISKAVACGVHSVSLETLDL